MKRGDELLTTARSVKSAAEAMRHERRRLLGEPLKGALDPTVKDCISADHYDYFKAMILEGVPSRRSGARRRTRAQPYGSALDHLSELYEKTLQEA